MRIEDMVVQNPGLFSTPDAQDVGTSDPAEFQSPAENISGTQNGLQIEHSRSDLNKGAGIRL